MSPSNLVKADSGYRLRISLLEKNVENQKYELKNILTNVDSEYFNNQTVIKTVYLSYRENTNDFIAIIRGENNCMLDFACPTIIYRKKLNKTEHVILFVRENITFTLGEDSAFGSKIGVLKFDEGNDVPNVNILISDRSISVALEKK